MIRSAKTKKIKNMVSKQAAKRAHSARSLKLKTAASNIPLNSSARMTSLLSLPLHPVHHLPPNFPVPHHPLRTVRHHPRRLEIHLAISNLRGLGKCAQRGALGPLRAVVPRGEPRCTFGELLFGDQLRDVYGVAMFLLWGSEIDSFFVF